MPDQKDNTEKIERSDPHGDDKTVAHDVFDSLKKAISGFTRLIQAYIEKNKRITWYYEEKHWPAYSMEAAIKWFKESRLLAKTSAAGIYRVSPEGDGVITLYLFFLDGESPILDGTQPCLVVRTSILDALLQAHFEQKDLVILK